MKKTFTILIAALFALTLITQSFSAMGQTYVYTLVKSIDDLDEEDVILIVNAKDDGTAQALGTTQNNNNRSAEDVSISDETIELLADAQEIILESKNANGYFTFKVGDDSYLYAANSSNGKNNYLRSKNDDAIYWQITINTTSYVAAVTDKTSNCNNRNKMKYNSDSSIFSCYSSSDNNLFIFKKEETGGDLEDNDLALTKSSLSFDLYNDYDPKEISYTTSSTGAVTVDANSYITATVNQSTKKITITPVKKTPSAQTITVRQAADETYKAGSKTFTVNITDSTPIEWVETSLANLTSGDVFVIVGNNGSTYAMTNYNNGSNPPSVQAVTIKNGKIDKDKTDVTEILLWNLILTDGGYSFYPAGSNDIWLNCTNSNSGVRVSSTAANAKHFTLSSNGYLTTTETNVQRYLGIYNSQDWRTYDSETGNIADQTFAFYKKVYDNNSTYHKEIEGCGSGTDNNIGYYLIASPVVSVTPSESNNILSNSYDLYYFDQSKEGAQWQNHKPAPFNLTTGKGYLYANSGNANSGIVELTFAGQPYNGNGVVGLIYEIDAYFKGWNLIGNPYPTTAYLPENYTFYRMNSARTELEAVDNVAITAMEGVFVKATAVNQTLTFTTTAPAKGFATGSKVVLNITDSKGNVIDRAIVRFDEGNTLPKFMLNENNTKLYIPREDDNYAVVLSDGKDNMPINFKPATTGKYTFNVEVEGIDMNYLHLIDRFTGEDVDLLMDNTYSFIGSQIDNDSRFILSFTAKGYSTTSDEPFAYQSGSDIIVDGEGELQIFDVTGRMVSRMNVNGVQAISADNLSNGVYVFRMVGSDVKTQKIIVR